MSWLRSSLASFLLFATVFSKEHVVYWNVSNPNFLFGPFEEGEAWTFGINMGDKLTFNCPKEAGEYDHLVIYRVEELAYLDCTLPSNAKEIIRCDKPGERLSTTIRTLSPFNVDLDYEPGRYYYFISTSGGKKEKIGQTTRGLCETYNMRLRLEIQAPPSTSAPPTTTSVYSTHPRARPHLASPGAGAPPRPIGTRRHTAAAGGAPPPPPPRVQEQREWNVEDEREPEGMLDTKTHPLKLSPEEITSALPSTINEDQLRQVVEWASRGLEGTFRYEMKEEGQKGDPNALNDEGAEMQVITGIQPKDEYRMDLPYMDGSYLIQEDAARYSASGSSTSSITVLVCLLITVLYRLR